LELVYLWVEDYKNIEKEGFNFSPRFECEFKDKYELIDGKEKLKNNCELIIKDKEHLKDFFGGNINITAIVGENGSGKSSLLEALADILSVSYSENNYLDEDRTYILIYKYEKRYYMLKNYINKNIKLLDEKNETITWINEITNQKLNTSHKDLATLIINNELQNQKIYDSEKIFVENTQVNTSRIKKIIISNYFNNKETLKKVKNDYFSPNKIEITIKPHKLQEDKDLYTEEVNDDVDKIIKDIKENKLNPSEKFEKVMEILKLKSDPLKGKLNSMNADKNLRTSTSIKYKYLDNRQDKLVENYTSFLKTLKKEVNNNIFYSFELSEINNEAVDFLFDLPDLFFNIDLISNEKSFEYLSYGERQLLTQLHFILFYSQKKKYDKWHYNNAIEEIDIKNMLIFLDEFELGLHPNWQKKSIHYIIEFLKKIDKKFTIIITSHSPFILSDIPKENVIFLKDGKQENVDINPFGANIHTLLSHGFFMEDGLMGEFAKGKIEEIIKNLNLKSYKPSKKDKEKILQIIKTIGEPFLKHKLEDMFYQKFDDIDLKKIRKLELEAEQKRIEKELKKL